MALNIIKDGFPTPPPPETLNEFGAMLFIEVSSTTEDATQAEAQIVYDICQNYVVDVKMIEDPVDREKWWNVRDSLAQKLARVRQEKWFNVVIADIGVPPSEVPHVLEEIYAITKQDGMPKGIAPYGHIGDGNLHITTTADRSSERGKELTNKFTQAVLDVVKSVGGTITAEHGPGFLKGIYVEAFYGTVMLDVLRAIKHAIDPENIMNPGQMGLDFGPFGERPTNQFIKAPEDFATSQKGGESA
jgi:glycolate oxidase